MTSENHADYAADDRRRPEYCFKDHLDLSRRVGDIESECRIIRAEFMGVKDQVFNMQSMMITVGKNTSEMATTATVLKAELAGIREMMALIHKYESAGGVAEMAKKVGAVLAVVVQVGALAGLVWAFLTFAKRAIP